MNNLTLISEINENINSLEAKIDKVDKNSTTIFAYLYNSFSELKNQIDNADLNVSSNDINMLNKKVIQLDLDSSTILENQKNIDSKMVTLNSYVSTNVNTIIADNNSISDRLYVIENRLTNIEKILNDYQLISSDYFIVNKAKLRTPFFTKIRNFFFQLFHKKKILEDLNNVETNTNIINERKEKERIDKIVKEQQLKEETKKKKIEQIKNLLK